jgi:hypothetical protein
MPQRSPLIFWLLLAATISVDAVAFTWAEAGHVHADHAFIAFEALMLSQIGVVCIWSSLNSEKFRNSSARAHNVACLGPTPPASLPGNQFVARIRNYWGSGAASKQDASFICHTMAIKHTRIVERPPLSLVPTPCPPVPPWLNTLSGQELMADRQID